MKKILVVLLILSLALTGCSGGSEPEEEKVEMDVSSGGDQISVSSDETEVTVTTDLNKSVDLPDGYPENILPIYKDLFLSAAVKNEDGSYMVVGMSQDDMEDIVAFYEDAVSGGEVMMKTEMDGSYMNIGELNGTTYSVTIAPLDDDELDYDIMVNLVVTPGTGMGMPVPESGDDDSSSESDDSDSSGSGELISVRASIPDGYPIDTMPIMNEEDSEIAIAETMGDRNLLGYMTKSSFDEVYDYYDDIFLDADNFAMTSMGPTTVFMGQIDGVNFEVGITENYPETGEDMSYKTLIQVFYY